MLFLFVAIQEYFTSCNLLKAIYNLEEFLLYSAVVVFNHKGTNF
jgi:hypothetical protein